MFDEEPEDSISLAEIMIGIGIALIVTPGLIWWGTVLWGLVA